jgi:disulfide bond formation protein DsbB
LYFALLAVVAQIFVLATIVLAVGARWSPSVRRARDEARQALRPQAVGWALVVAAVCTLGSLYLSEVAHFTPCRLCWYQRAAMYPLVPLLAVGAWTRSRALRLVAAVVATGGAAISCWHILIERYPTLESGSCDPNNPCSLVWVKHLGYLTIPTMALSGFALILALLAVAGVRPPPPPQDRETHAPPIQTF